MSSLPQSKLANRAFNSNFNVHCLRRDTEYYYLLDLFVSFIQRITIAKILRSFCSKYLVSKATWEKPSKGQAYC